MARNNKIRLGISSWSPQQQTMRLFQGAGYDISINEELGTAEVDDPEIECFLARAKEIAPLVGKEILDAGIVTRATLAETKTKGKVRLVADLGTLNPNWTETRVVAAAPEKSKINSVKDLKNKKIITRVPEITKAFLKKHGVSAVIEFADGTNEAKVKNFADAIVEFTNTEETLKCYKLRIIATIMKDTAVVVANKKSWSSKWKREKIGDLATLLRGARLAQEMVALMFHVSNLVLKHVLKVIPALKKPTITPLRGENWFDVLTIVNKKEIRNIVPKLKELGCSDIVELPLNKIVI